MFPKLLSIVFLQVSKHVGVITNLSQLHQKIMKNLFAA